MHLCVAAGVYPNPSLSANDKAVCLTDCPEMEKWLTGAHLIVHVDLREAGFPRYSLLKGVWEYL